MIRFLAKIAVQRLIKAVPGGPALYEWNRRRSVLAGIEEIVAQKRAVAERYVEILRAAGGVDVAGLGPHLDFGGGWLPVIPLTFRRYGTARQSIVDIARLMRPEAAAAAAVVLDRLDPTLPPLAPWAGEPEKECLSRLGIDYDAPLRPPLPFADGSFGLVSGTQTLQYPPPDDIRIIHREAARLLRPGGFYLFSIELTDLYHHFDPALPRFNFLRYSAAAWRRWFDNPYTPLNRLRAVEHLALLAEAPFDILFQETAGGGPEDLAELRRAPPHPEFARLPDVELARTELTVLARRR